MSRFQNGSLLKIKRRNGEQVWAFRWYEYPGGSRTYRKRIVGTVAQLPHRRDAERAVSSLRININAGVQAPQTVAELVAHYRKTELVPERKAASSIYVNGMFLSLYVVPRWGEVGLSPCARSRSKAGFRPCPMLRAPRPKSATLCPLCSTMPYGTNGR